MPISYFNINGWFREDPKVNQENSIVIEVNPNKPTNYIKIQASTVVTHVMSYDVLVLYSLGVNIDFWEKIT
jgi:hypothetical protein